MIIKPARMPIISDETAADALPMRLTVAVILIAIIGMIIALSVLDLMSAARTHEAQVEISKIVHNAEQMSLRGVGSVITLDIDIPDGVTVVFGALPGNEHAWPNDAVNYYIKIDSEQRVYETGAAFSNFEMDGAAELSSGPHRITLESVYNSDSTRVFILVYETGDNG
ncbi:MAG: hypothetical protein ACT6FE_03300 [Methanosarcinaceae archaeon]